MLRLILIVLLLIVTVYLILWLKRRFWNRLTPQVKKQIITFGLLNIFNFLKLKWQIILMFSWQILKKLISKRK